MTTTNAPSSSDFVTPSPPARFVLPLRHTGYKYVAIAAAMLALARCWAIVGIYNHTTDELAHIAGAVGLMETGRNLYMVEHPPLQRLVVGAALRAAGVEYPAARQAEGVQARPDANVAGAEIVFEGRVPYWTVLAVARRANLVFAAVLLLYVYLMGRYLANPLAGMLAVLFVSLDANFLGHSALVTTDIPAAAGFLAATYHAIRFVARPTWRTASIAGVALGLAMACKFTCVLLVPAIVLLIGVRAVRKIVRRRRRRHRRHVERSETSGSRVRGQILRKLRMTIPPLRYFAAIAVIAFFALWATYLFNVGRLEDQHLFDEEKGWQRIPQGVKSALIPMPSMPLGVMFMAAIGKTGFPCYFNGQLDFYGHLAYFPEAIAIKSPTGLVVALGLAVAACAMARRRRRAILALCLVLPPCFLMLTAMTGRLQIGIRHVLPVIPFVYLFAVFYLHRGRWAWALVPLILVSGVETAERPYDYLPFFNMIVGGSENGSKYLADSNLDWGQDVARLSWYLKRVAASDYTIKVSGVRVAALVSYLGLDPKSRDRDVEELRQHPHGLLALGVNARLGLEEFKKNKDGSIQRGPDYSWVKQYPMVQRLGYSIEVYDLDAKPK